MPFTSRNPPGVVVSGPDAPGREIVLLLHALALTNNVFVLVMESWFDVSEYLHAANSPKRETGPLHAANSPKRKTGPLHAANS